MGKLKMLAAGLAGAGLAYLFDPQMGRSRRARMMDQAKARGRRAADRSRATAKYEANRLQGAVHEMRSEGTATPDDATLLQKVKSEAIGLSQTPVDGLDVQVENGVVRLRGVVPRSLDATDLLERVQDVAGVRRIESELRPAASG